MRSFLNSSGLFTARSRSSTNNASTISLSGKALPSAVPASTGRKASSAPIRRGFAPNLHVIDCLLHGIDGAGRIGLRLRHPERIVFLLKAFHAMAEISRLLARALGIDEDRQIAA